MNIKRLIIILIILSHQCFSQEIKTDIFLDGKILNFDISIYNNTNKRIIIPLYYWGFTTYAFENISWPFLGNQIANHISPKFKKGWIADGDNDYKYNILPYFTCIDTGKTNLIIIKMDTSNLKVNELYKYFDIKFSVADEMVLRHLFSILKLNLEDFIINEQFIEINLNQNMNNQFFCERFKSKLKLKNDYPRIISLPFLNYIEFSGVLRTN